MSSKCRIQNTISIVGNSGLDPPVAAKRKTMAEETPDTWTAKRDFQGGIDYTHSITPGWGIYRNNVIVAVLCNITLRDAEETEIAHLLTAAPEVAQQRDELLAICQRLIDAKEGIDDLFDVVVAARTVVAQVESTNQRKNDAT